MQLIKRKNQSAEVPNEWMRLAEDDRLRPGQPWEGLLAFLNASNQLLKENIPAREAGRQAQAVQPGWGSATTWAGLSRNTGAFL